MFIYIPGEAITVFTFPGIMLHEMAHQFFCDLFNIPVYEVSYFHLNSKSAGHVIHGITNNTYQAFCISMAPLLINTIACMIMTFPAATIHYFGSTQFPPSGFIYITMAWIGYSAGFNAIPSNQDMNQIHASTFLGKIILFILSKIIWICNIPYLNNFIALIYTYCVSLILPILFLTKLILKKH
jgi:hypothetical protein